MAKFFISICNIYTFRLILIMFYICLNYGISFWDWVWFWRVCHVLLFVTTCIERLRRQNGEVETKHLFYGKDFCFIMRCHAHETYFRCKDYGSFRKNNQAYCSCQVVWLMRNEEVLFCCFSSVLMVCTYGIILSFLHYSGIYN